MTSAPSLRRLAPKGPFIAPTVVNMEMLDFLGTIRNDPRPFTAIVRPSSEGLAVSVTIK